MKNQASDFTAKINNFDLTEIENMRLYNHFGQINAPKSNDKVEINAGNYTICYYQFYEKTQNNI